MKQEGVLVSYSKRSGSISASSSWILLSAALGLLTLGGCYTLYEVRPLGKPDKPTEGIVYVLPQTELVMDVEIERTVLTLGRFAEFAKEFGLTTTPHDQCPDGERGEAENPKTKWRLACTPKVLAAELSAFGVPDRDQRFHVTIVSERKVVDRALNFKLLEDGRMTEAGAEFHDRSAEVALQVTSKVLEIAAATAGAFLGLGEDAHPCKAVAADWWSRALRRPRRQLPPSQQEKEEACLNYVRLEDLKKQRKAVIEALKKLGSLNEHSVPGAIGILGILDDEIGSIEELFSVTQTTSPRTVRRTFIPKPGNTSQTFYVTRKGELVPKPTKPTDPKLTLKVDAKSPSPPQEKPLSSGKKCGPKSGNGLVYRVPESGTAQVISEDSLETRILASERVNLPQFGRFATLPNCFHKLKTTLEVALFPDTGMLQAISLREEALPNEEVLLGSLDAMGTATDALANAVTAQSGAEAAEDEALEALKKEKELLEAEKEKREAERQVNCYRETGKPCSDE